MRHSRAVPALVGLVLAASAVGCCIAGTPAQQATSGARQPASRSLSAKMNDDDLERAAYERGAAKLNADPSRERQLFAALSAGRKMVVATIECEGEVNNGGFHQYYWNTGGRDAQAALAGYRLIGAKRHAALVERAISVARKELAKMRRLKEGATEETLKGVFVQSERGTAFSSLDDPFFKAEKTEPVTRLRAAYIRKHLKAF